MNFSEFSFWWVLLLFSIPYFTVRYVAKLLNLWRGIFDAVGLAAISSLLFVNASRSSFAIFVCEIIFNYVMVWLMLRQQGWKAKAIATTVIIIDIAILAYFKYLNFFVEDVLGLLVPGLAASWQGKTIPGMGSIPPGLSFYTFQMVAFVVDSYNSRKKQAIGALDYVNFVSFFPQVVAGPIERRGDLFPQIESFRFKFTYENFESGFRWLSLGLFMKFVLADNISPYIKLDQAQNPWLVWFFAFLFTLQIYFDFGGYSFIALGLAKFLGINLTINFLAPYTSQSINEFWRRWHVTLSTWFRDYVFLPLMGKNKKWAPFYLFLTFTLSGFWHGAAWNFIFWGAYHGLLLLIIRYAGRPFYKLVGQQRFLMPQFISWALTFGSVILGCLFFMETNTPRLLEKLQTIVNPWAYSLSNLGAAMSFFSGNEAIALGFTLALAITLLLMEHIGVWQQRECEYDLLLSPWVSRVLLALTVLLAANTPSPFIYFEF
ncbi:MBOAT family O-acyltransferase [Anabaena subtropica]|uniref:MBOAT family protein n=1 Tax=Anabaena subtropica FACHB-260 TaxID=2692884 RepID=A0ABR8CVR4_9NOST|nr:MBOAT family protein [Anabaena subtropica]MBD2346458.1 MBOAT family protein [Anabaena subtropica FACHB-260]